MERILVTRHGKNAAILFPLSDPKKIPLDLRRKLFRELTDDIARQLDAKGVTDEDVESAFSTVKKRRRR